MVCVTDCVVMVAAIVSKGKEGNQGKDKEERHGGERQEVARGKRWREVSRGADRETLQDLPLSKRNLRQIIGAWAPDSRRLLFGSGKLS